MKYVIALLFTLTLAACAPEAPERDPGPWQGSGLISKTTPEGVKTDYIDALNCRSRVGDGYAHYYTVSIPKAEEKRFEPFRRMSTAPANQQALFKDAVFQVREHRSFSTNNSRSGITSDLLYLDADLRVETNDDGRRHLTVISRKTFEQAERSSTPYINDWFSLFTVGIKAGDDTFAFQDTKDGVAYASPRLLPHLIEGTLVECL